MSGVVADATDKTALAMATVSFQGKHPKATLANADGRFSINLVAGESYVMKVSYVATSLTGAP
nr:carboxypeptidase-like regulatory domain-containing protein [Segatella baroniae]